MRPMLLLLAGLCACDADTDEPDPELVALQARVEALEAQLDSEEGGVDLVALETRVGTNASDLATQATAIDDLEGDASTLATAVDGLQTDLAAAESDLATVQTDLGGVETAVTDLEGDLDAVEGRVQTLETAGGGGLVIDDAVVFEGTTPTDWTTLDLGDQLGGPGLALLQLDWSSGTGDEQLFFGALGDATVMEFNTDSVAWARVRAPGVAHVLVPTDADGRIEWRAENDEPDFRITLVAHVE